MQKNHFFAKKTGKKRLPPAKMAAPINEDGKLYLPLFLSGKTLMGCSGVVAGGVTGSSHLGILGNLGMGWDWQQQELKARAEAEARIKVRTFMKEQ